MSATRYVTDAERANSVLATGTPAEMYILRANATIAALLDGIDGMNLGEYEKREDVRALRAIAAEIRGKK